MKKAILVLAVLLFMSAPAPAQCGATKRIGEAWTFYVNTHDPDSTYEEADADSAPTWRMYENETTTPVATGTMALLDDANTVGFYSDQVTLSSGTFSLGNSYTVRIRAIVSTHPANYNCGVTIIDYQEYQAGVAHTIATDPFISTADYATLVTSGTPDCEIAKDAADDASFADIAGTESAVGASGRSEVAMTAADWTANEYIAMRCSLPGAATQHYTWRVLK